VFHTEYSSLRFALFYMAEFMNTITMSAVMVTLFFGGPDGPGFHFLRWLWPIVWFAGKTVVFLYVYVWTAARLGSATTSSWALAGRSSSRSRSDGCWSWRRSGPARSGALRSLPVQPSPPAVSGRAYRLAQPRASAEEGLVE